MSAQFLYDSVTLQHFAVAGSLTLLSSVHKDASEPRWTEQVHREVQAGVGLIGSSAACQAVVDFSWLGEPVEGDVVETLQLRALLDGSAGADEHLGEAESIAVARASGATFVTDDGPAYDFASHRANLGAGRVQDVCAILWTAAGLSLIDEAGMQRFHIAVFDAQRTMRCRCRFWPGGDTLEDRMRALRRRDR